MPVELKEYLRVMRRLDLTKRKTITKTMTMTNSKFTVTLE